MLNKRLEMIAKNAGQLLFQKMNSSHQCCCCRLAGSEAKEFFKRTSLADDTLFMVFWLSLVCLASCTACLKFTTVPISARHGRAWVLHLPCGSQQSPLHHRHHQLPLMHDGITWHQLGSRICVGHRSGRRPKLCHQHQARV